MLVWRMQNAQGEGPYSKASWSTWRDAHTDSSGMDTLTGKYRQPSPLDDGLGYAHNGRLFGFTTYDQLREWFSPTERERLTGLGFYPMQVKATHVRYGGHQVTFEPV